MAKILVADDQADLLQLVDTILTMAGHHVVTAKSREEFLSRLSSLKPDVIILDVMIGADNGRDICREIKAAEHKHIPVILYSANPELLESYEECAADDVLHKPFEIKLLVDKVNRVLEALKDH